MSAVQTLVGHEWRMVAPWWNWPLRHPEASLEDQAESAAVVRRSAPTLQKYDGADLVNTFIADPQLRLSFRPSSDEVHTVTPGDRGIFSLPRSRPTGVRKLYLGSHHRNYLVVASLHCTAPGFPHVERDAACQAGFVVRRRTTTVSAEGRRAGGVLLARLSAARRRRVGASAQVAAAERAGHTVRQVALEARLRSAAAVEQAALEDVGVWARESGVTSELQGWVPQGVRPDGTIGPVPACGSPQAADAAAAALPLAGVGAWQAVTELPEFVEEATFSLSALVADPTKPEHDAAGESIWFGVVPTGSSDVSTSGAPRFDDSSRYEIVCFVRRHRPECPREGPHCRCPVIWSEPTEPYQLAPHLDLEGTANRPVTVQLPDLGRLQAEALRLGPGRTGGVRLQTPTGSAMPFSTDNLDATALDESSGARFCSFAIPLLTIVATFLFKLFLPIVVLVFQLWFLLALRFCSPPEAEVSAGSQLGLALSELDVGLDISVAAAAKLLPGGAAGAEVTTALNTMFGKRKDRANVPLAVRLTESLTQPEAAKRLDPRLYAGIVRNALAQGPKPPPDRETGAEGPVFAPRVERFEVVSP